MSEKRKPSAGARLFGVVCLGFMVSPFGSLAAQSIRDNAGQAASAPLPLKKISLFSSGLAYYEHSGTVNGAARIILPFKTAAVNDALKSLVLNDPASPNPQVSYQSEQTLWQTLRSLSIDLSGGPDMAAILGRLRGAEVDIAAPSAVSGRIAGVEYRNVVSPFGETVEPWVLLYTAQGLRLFNLKEISSLSFKDPKIASDLGRALDLIAASRNADTRNLTVSLPGSAGGGSRQVSLSYVIPAPVWKVSYRLDLQGAAAGGADGTACRFQGWAIIDNDGDTDWNNVELSLVAGRPASFIQNLYPPYYQYRPTLPLSIAGTAAAEAHDSGYAAPAPGFLPESSRNAYRNAPLAAMKSAAERAESPEMDDAASVTGGGRMEGAQGAAAGDQFEFTLPGPVALNRQTSAMLPLVESPVTARKALFFSGANTVGENLHPRLGAELTNTTGMKLPAGPITVYDGGTYAGDALINFWNENEKRFVSYGEDLSVSGSVMETSSRTVVAVTASGGVMSINRSQDYLKTYTFKNNAAQSKQIVVEHPKTSGASLESPEADEQTPSAYRFTMTLPAGRELLLMVRESRPVQERINLLQLRPDAFVSYTGSQEIPPRVRAALQKAVDLKRDAASAEAAVADLESRKNGLAAEQDRIRKNLEAAGSQTQQGQEYLKRLVALDNDIDRVTPELDKLRASAKAAGKAYEDYLNTLNL